VKKPIEAGTMTPAQVRQRHPNVRWHNTHRFWYHQRRNGHPLLKIPYKAGHA
jgi:hypothetical protein